jgi:hypothetical protein
MAGMEKYRKCIFSGMCFKTNTDLAAGKVPHGEYTPLRPLCQPSRSLMA